MADVGAEAMVDSVELKQVPHEITVTSRALSERAGQSGDGHEHSDMGHDHEGHERGEYCCTLRAPGSDRVPVWRIIAKSPSSHSPRVNDRLCRGRRIFVLPEAHYSPTGIPKVGSRLCITATVLLDLRSPVVGVRLGRNEVFGATMPETSIHEHRDAGASEDDVRSSPPVLTRSKVSPVAQTPRMEDSPDPQLRLGITAPIRLHRQPRPFGRGPGITHQRVHAQSPLRRA
ncbi:hypothetical protein BJEO58_01005 [Brevibacterium jeotgali]|uniref:Uncharacterized protein n=1 Tax=Brevibacterium jeotgali TaxID=1262550 RepID=A0A2H1L3Q9_9MICO|nr:hypothetical protein FB108_0327 [Brevibacterium jeotgali]SMY11420.1 hypothetical protein BJEO58_01005 [Brevibacterium jeotgali]